MPVAALPYLADAVLATHVALVAFVILMVPLVFLGAWRDWAWVRRPLLRLGHLVIMAVVVMESWAGIVCPLTTLEMWLRREAGVVTYQGDFIAHWLQRLLYWDFAPWVFTVAYTAFGLLIVLTWVLVPPRARGGT